MIWKQEKLDHPCIKFPCKQMIFNILRKRERRERKGKRIDCYRMRTPPIGGGNVQS
jgi:hypothetical protein